MTGPEQQSETPDNFMRLNRFLARAGVGSRRNCDKLIDSGRIAVNGQVVSELGVKVNPESDNVTFEGKRVQLPSVDVVLMLNKPAGVYTTMSDPQGRPCVAEYVPTEQYPGIYHVGRLDRDTTGLLLLTSDGQLGHQLQHPSKHVDKTYIAQVEGLLSATQIRRLRDGIDIKVGNTVKRTAPAEIDVLSWKDLQREGFDVRQSCLERNRSESAPSFVWESASGQPEAGFLADAHGGRDRAAAARCAHLTSGMLAGSAVRQVYKDPLVQDGLSRQMLEFCNK